mgnify:CR=1 FL=1
MLTEGIATTQQQAKWNAKMGSMWGQNLTLSEIDT